MPPGINTVPLHVTGEGEYPAARIDYFSRHAVESTFESGTFYLVDGMKKVFMAAVLQGMGQVAAFAEALDKVTHSSDTQMQNAHHQLGLLMQAATLVAYDEAEAAFGRHDEPYRAGATAGSTKGRFAGGRLRRAIQNERFFHASPDGIGFVNTTLLEAEARQWHRLNFGALPAGGAKVGKYNATWDGLVVATLGFADEESSAPFSMPHGFWGGEDHNQFRPLGLALVKPTKGIHAWNFLDAGPRVLAQHLPEAYAGVYAKWFESAQAGKGPLSRVTAVNIPPPRMTPLQAL